MIPSTSAAVTQPTLSQSQTNSGVNVGVLSPEPQLTGQGGFSPKKTHWPLPRAITHVLAFLPLWLLGELRKGERDDRVLLAGLAVRELRKTRSAGGHGRFRPSLELPCGEDEDGLGELTLGFRFLEGGFSLTGVGRGERPRGGMEDTAEFSEPAGVIWLGVCSLVLALRVRGNLTVTSSSEESSVSATEEFCSFGSRVSALSGLHFLCRKVRLTWGLGDLSGELSNVSFINMGLELTLLARQDFGGRPRLRLGGDTGSSAPLLLVPSVGTTGMLEETLGIMESAERADTSSFCS